MSCVPSGATHAYYGQVPDELREPVEIECIGTDAGHDLFVGRVRRGNVAPVRLSTELPRAGDSVCLSGYPMAVLSINQRGGFVANVRRYWQPAHVIDATQTIIDGRKHDGYIVDQPCLSGMSGGPVFDVAGNLRGMAVATLTRIIPEMDGDPYVVRNRIVVDSAQLQAFVDQHRASC